MKHKFVNKKIGAEARVIAMYLDSDGVMQIDGYDTVEDLMDDYAAYEEYIPPKEPLIEHEIVRKALKWWAVSNGITNDASLLFVGASNGFTCENQYISFDSAVYDMSEKLISGNTYELGELCGEEEE